MTDLHSDPAMDADSFWTGAFYMDDDPANRVDDPDRSPLPEPKLPPAAGFTPPPPAGAISADSSFDYQPMAPPEAAPSFDPAGHIVGDPLSTPEPIVAAPEPQSVLVTPTLPVVDRDLTGLELLEQLPFAGDDEPDEDQSPSLKRLLVEWVLVLGCAGLVAFLIAMFVIQAFKIPSESMVDTLEVNDRVLVNKLAYDFHDVNRGDVVVFERPPNSKKNSESDPDDLIKRVIALPGERVVARDGHVFVNERELTEPYVPDGERTDHLDLAVTVPAGKVFVMGDNRTHSYDSRYFGAVDQSLIVGRAFAIVWPPSRAGSL